MHPALAAERPGRGRPGIPARGDALRGGRAGRRRARPPRADGASRPGGAFRGVHPQAARTSSSTSCARPTPSGEIRQFFDPLLLPADPGRAGPLPLQRGQRAPDLREARGAPARSGRRRRASSFAVWAPVRGAGVGGRQFQPLGRPLPPDAHRSAPPGVWELFIPGLGEGELYKFEIRDQRGRIRLKTDPYGTYFEAPPGNAAIVCDAAPASPGTTPPGSSGAAPQAGQPRPADVDLRGAPRLVEAEARGRRPPAHLPRARAAAGRLRRARWASPTSR